LKLKRDTIKTNVTLTKLENKVETEMGQKTDDGTMIKLKLKPNDTLELTIKWDTRQRNWDTRQIKIGHQPN
jgi:hypothetical protein